MKKRISKPIDLQAYPRRDMELLPMEAPDVRARAQIKPLTEQELAFLPEIEERRAPQRLLDPRSSIQNEASFANQQLLQNQAPVAPQVMEPQQSMLPETAPQDLGEMVAQLLRERTAIQPAPPQPEPAPAQPAPTQQVVARTMPLSRRRLKAPEAPVAKAQPVVEKAAPFAQQTIPAGMEQAQPITRPAAPQGIQRLITARAPRRMPFITGATQQPLPPPNTSRFYLPYKVGTLFDNFRKTLI